jgi:branched-chain amino acid transport system ATP-binding protein
MPQDLTQVDSRKLDLARAMIAKPQLLFVDEAMAGLSHSEVDEILAVLMRMAENAVAIVMIEHIMRAVTAFSQRLVVLVAGRKLADGNPQQVLANVEVQRAYLGESPRRLRTVGPLRSAAFGLQQGVTIPGLR